jgi:hypothetical protein
MMVVVRRDPYSFHHINTTILLTLYNLDTVDFGKEK